MKKWWISLLLLTFVWAALGCAEERGRYTYIDAENYIRSLYLTGKGRLSDDRYWYAGTTREKEPWLLISDSMGNVIDQRIVAVAKKEQVIEGINVSDEGVLIGLVDMGTLKGMIMYKDHDGKTRYTELGQSNVFEYTPTEDGGLIAQCVWYNEDETLCALQIMRIDADGAIRYDIIEEPVEIAVDRGALTQSCLREEGGRVYALLVEGIPAHSGTREELICYDENGKEVWRAAIPDSENLGIEDVMVDGENIYLIGYRGEWLSEYILGNRKALVLCYSQDGTQKWVYTASDVQEFRYGGAGGGLCVAGEMLDDRWTFLVLSDGGREIFRGDMEAVRCYMQKIFVTEDRRILILGTTDEKLTIRELTYE